MTQETNNLAADLWALADLLRGDFKQSQYGRVILPFALLRRLECVLESSKSAVLVEATKVEKMAIAEEAKEKLLLRATSGLSFFNTSPMDLSTLGESGIKANLERYIQCFSKDAREIFDHFKFAEFIGLLNDANLLYKVVQKVRTMDLHPKAVSNYEMGLVFEELIRKFAESSNETAGEHFIDLGNVVLSHYRVAKIRQQDLLLRENTGEYKLEPGEGLGTAKPKDRQEEYLSQIINRLNEVFVTDQLTDKDMVNYAYTIRDKVGENIKVMKQIENNSAEQALLGDFSKAIDDAILDSSEAHQNQMMQLLADPSKAANFARIVFDLLVQGQARNP